MTVIEELTNQLFDYASQRPDGFTYKDVRRDLGWNRATFLPVVRALRAVFADDKITLPCVPGDQRAPWIYRLTIDGDQVSTWHANRVGDTDTRLETIENVNRSRVNATDGRSIEGRRARLIVKVISRLREDLGELSEAV